MSNKQTRTAERQTQDEEEEASERPGSRGGGGYRGGRCDAPPTDVHGKAA
jgi:hypothetical protein